MRICLIASSRFPICEPFAGGLEALTHGLAGELTRRGHEVALFAAPGSDPELPVATLDLPTFVPSEAARADVQAQPDLWLNEHHAYLALMLDLLAGGDSRFDVVHNNSLHHLPVAMAPALTVPMLTTLHTPPVPWLESAVALAPAGSRFAAVSRFTAASWAHATPSVVVLNGVDVGSFPFGPGGGPAVWTGRVVPEKAPHEAIEAARLAGLPLVLAGPIFDRGYFERCVEPLLGGQVSYAGHLGGRDLRRLLGRASVAVVTPNWDEPYGLVAAEAMACGTPVAAYARGALPEVVAPGTGVLSAPGDVSRLAEAMVQALDCDRATVRAYAERACSLDRMVDEYELLYANLAPVHEAA